MNTQTKTNSLPIFHKLNRATDRIMNKDSKKELARVCSGDIKLIGWPEDKMFNMHYKSGALDICKDTVFFSLYGYIYMLVFDASAVADEFNLLSTYDILMEDMKQYIALSRSEWIPKHRDDFDVEEFTKLIVKAEAE